MSKKKKLTISVSSTLVVICVMVFIFDLWPAFAKKAGALPQQSVDRWYYDPTTNDIVGRFYLQCNGSKIKWGQQTGEYYTELIEDCSTMNQVSFLCYDCVLWDSEHRNCQLWQQMSCSSPPW